MSNLQGSIDLLKLQRTGIATIRGVKCLCIPIRENDIYVSVDENLNIFMNTRTKLVPIEQVSSGTMDQIYLALRLAVARLMQGKNDPLPLIFDDSFVQYDDERLRTALARARAARRLKRQGLRSCGSGILLMRREPVPFVLLTKRNTISRTPRGA